MKTKLLLASTALAPVIASAHPGHDHSSPYALLIHLAWIAPALIAVGVFTYNLKRKNKTSK